MGDAVYEARRRGARLPQRAARVGPEAATAQQPPRHRRRQHAVQVRLVVGGKLWEGRPGEHPLAGQKLLLAVADEDVNVEANLFGEPQAGIEILCRDVGPVERRLQ